MSEQKRRKWNICSHSLTKPRCTGVLPRCLLGVETTRKQLWRTTVTFCLLALGHDHYDQAWLAPAQEG